MASNRKPPFVVTVVAVLSANVACESATESVDECPDTSGVSAIGIACADDGAECNSASPARLRSPPNPCSRPQRALRADGGDTRREAS
jgi:hypothetical protein